MYFVFGKFSCACTQQAGGRQKLKQVEINILHLLLLEDLIQCNQSRHSGQSQRTQITQ